MEPPWARFPQMRLGSIAWRMGAGEEYWYEFQDWFAGLGVDARFSVQKKWPEPDGWAGFYERTMVDKQARLR